MFPTRPKIQSTLKLEWFLAFAVIAAILLDVNFLFGAGYLPPPFLYDTFDTYMDWFNTSDFAVNPGAYDVWRSIYPPVSFAFLKIFSVHSCYVGGPVLARDCDWLGRAALFSFFVLDIVVVARAYFVFDPRTAIPRTIATGLGLPLLFALDRGNLIVVCFFFYALGLGPVLRSARFKWLCLATAINFKPYLIASAVGYVLTRRWRALEGVAIACVAVYAISYAFYGAGDPRVLLKNILDFQGQRVDSVFGPMFYGSSYSSTLNGIDSPLPLMQVLGSRPLEWLDVILRVLMRTGQVAVVLAFITAVVKKERLSTSRLTALGVSFALTSVEVGGYAEVFLVFLVFLRRSTGLADGIAIFLSYALSVPFDFIIFPIAHEIHTGYLMNRTVGYDLGVTAGMLVRPLLEIGLQLSLAWGVVDRAFRTPWPGATLERVGDVR